MKIHLYCTLWNEEKILPYFIKHYSQFCDKMIFYDNESTDLSALIINSHPKTELRSYSTNNTLDDTVHVNIKERAIIEAKKEGADYAIVVDCDEFLYHPNMREFLHEAKSQFSLFYPIGFQMVSEKFPTTSGQIYDEIRTGKPDGWYCKPVLVNLKLVNRVKFLGGIHDISSDIPSEISGKIYHPIPEELRQSGQYGGKTWGNLHHLVSSADRYLNHDLKLFHYKFIGRDYVKSRYQMYAARNSNLNKRIGHGLQYQRSIENNTIDQDFDELIKVAKNVF